MQEMTVSLHVSELFQLALYTYLVIQIDSL